MGKPVYIEGEALYIRPYFLDKGENLPEGEQKDKILRTGGIYTTQVKLPFDNRDDAEEYLNSKGIPTDGLMGNLLKRVKRDDGSVDIVYKVVRPHEEPNFDEPYMGPPKVLGADNSEWDKEVLIGNGSKITVKLDVWVGTKSKKVRWEAVRVEELIPYEPEEGGF